MPTWNNFVKNTGLISDGKHKFLCKFWHCNIGEPLLHTQMIQGIRVHLLIHLSKGKVNILLKAVARAVPDFD